AQANGSLNLFFGPVLGRPTADLRASAAATPFGGSIDSFQSSQANGRILPMTYDVNHWNNFLQTGSDPDGNKTTDANGNPTLQVYPSVKYKGNFGLLSLDDSHAGASTISGWVDNGMSSTDLQALTSA